MDFNFSELTAHNRYKLLVSVVVPRPIALVTSLDEDGRGNAAPFSFFNAIGSDPPLVVLGVGNRGSGVAKDTAHNIRRTGEFVVNIVDEAMGPAMAESSVDFPRDVDEAMVAGLKTLPSIQVRPPRLAASPVCLECREHSTLEIGRNRIIIGEVLHLHVRDNLIDPVALHVHTDKMHAIGRMHGGGWYTRTNDLFQLPRLSYDEWLEENG